MTDAHSSITAALQTFVDRKQLAGAVTVIASADKVLDTQAVGFADIEANKPMSPDAMFWIASTTKPMTATAFMTLVDDGKVDPADLVENYLPEFKKMWWAADIGEEQIVLKRPTRPITIHDLLTHTAGLPFLSKSEPVIDARPLREGVVSAASGMLIADPGTKYLYSNAGTNTVGRIIEVVSGMPYETFMQKRVFDPLGMADTTFFPAPAQLSRLARTYKANEAKDGLEAASLTQFLDPFPSSPRYAAPGGGLFSAAADVTRFARMILRGGELDGRHVVSRDGVRRMTGTQTELREGGGPGTGYGYQFSTQKLPTPGGPSPAGACDHGGAYSNQMWIEPDAGLVIVIMVQHMNWPTIEGDNPLAAFKKLALEHFRQ